RAAGQAVGPGDGGEPARAAAGHARGAACDEGERSGEDPQHLLGRGGAADPGDARLRCLQGRARKADHRRRPGARARRHRRQLPPHRRADRLRGVRLQHSRARPLRVGAHGGRCGSRAVDARAAARTYRPGHGDHGPASPVRCRREPHRTLTLAMSEGRREAGILLPLFSVRGQRDWGIGEIADLAPLVRWVAAAGHGLLQLLPIVETSPGERSPYAALSAFAIDSIYLALREVEDFVAAGGEEARAPGDRVDQGAARRQLERNRLFHEYVQWLAAEQWSAARRAAAEVGVRLKGDLPFMVAGDSADVWARPHEFDLGCNVGAPPDAFNERGQDWGLPVYRWDAMAATDFHWLRGRVARAARLFDAVRVDHVVGYYRIWILCPGADGRFLPDDEGAQLALGERLLGVALGAAGDTRVIAEDLGTVPPFVRRSLAALGIPGYRVLRWEEDAGAFRDPTSYPRLSVATSGTHDTTTLAVWWSDELGEAGRRALAGVPPFAGL